jgi:predicted outer membrane repeat protein
MLRSACLAVLLVPSAFAGGETLVVNSTLDLPDADTGDGVCDADLAAEGQQITLRAAIMHGNSIKGDETIELPAGVYKLTLQGHDEDDGATGDLDITDGLTITGAGALTTIVDGKKAKDRVFDIAEEVTVVLQDFTVRRGAAPTKDIDDQRGGGLRNEGELTLTRMIVTRCRTGDADGGGISNEGGSLLVQDSILSKNKAGDDGGGVDASSGSLTFTNVSFVKNSAKSDGGGLQVSPASASLTSCTFSANKAADSGGALSINGGSDVTLINCTLAKNKAKAAGSGIDEDDTDAEDTIGIVNCIVSNKPTTNYAGDGMTSSGSNVDSGSTCGFDGPGDLQDTDPRLLKLSKTPGELPVHHLKPDSPCIDAADDAECPATDQLGQARVDIPGVGVGKTVGDIGAVEFVPASEG